MDKNSKDFKATMGKMIENAADDIVRELREIFGNDSRFYRQ